MKKTRPGLQRGQERGDVGLSLQRGARGLHHRHAQLGGDDVRQRGLAQPRRTGKQHVVKRLAAAPGGLDEHLELRGDLLLVDEVGQALRAKRAVQVLLAAREAGVGQALRGAVPLCGVAGFPGLLDPGVAGDAHVLAPLPSAARRSAAPISSSALSPSRPVEQPLGLRERVAQMHEPVAGECALVAILRGVAGGTPLGELARNLLAQLDDQSLGGSLADARRGLEALRVPRRDRPQKLSRRAAGEDRYRHLRADPGDRDEVEEEIALLLVREPVQGQRVVAGDQVRVQGGLLSPRGHGLERLRRDRQAVADAAGLDHDVVGTADEHLAADRGDHPTWTSDSLAANACAGRVWPAWQIATARASAVWSDCGGSGRPSRVPTMR